MQSLIRTEQISIGNTSKHGGYYYNSKLEASSAKLLDKMLEAGEVLSWEREHKIYIDFHNSKGELLHSWPHKVDFKADLPDGSILLIEAKGRWFESYKALFRLIGQVYLPQHLDTEYRVWVDAKSHYWYLRNSLKKY